MPDTNISSLFICPTRYTQTRLRVMRCPTCKTRRRHLAQFQDWYGWYTTCLTCGATWADGEMLPRPFAPRWRKAAVAKAKATWKRHRESRKVGASE